MEYSMGSAASEEGDYGEFVHSSASDGGRVSRPRGGRRCRRRGRPSGRAAADRGRARDDVARPSRRHGLRHRSITRSPLAPVKAEACTLQMIARPCIFYLWDALHSVSVLLRASPTLALPRNTCQACKHVGMPSSRLLIHTVMTAMLTALVSF